MNSTKQAADGVLAINIAHEEEATVPAMKAVHKEVKVSLELVNSLGNILAESSPRAKVADTSLVWATVRSDLLRNSLRVSNQEVATVQILLEKQCTIEADAAAVAVESPPSRSLMESGAHSESPVIMLLENTCTIGTCARVGAAASPSPTRGSMLESARNEDPVRMLLEKQCSIGSEAVAGAAAFASPTRSSMEVGARCEGPVISPDLSLPVLENENPGSPRGGGDEVVSPAAPLAPTKPTRARSLSALFPGKTRRRLEFDYI